MSIKSDDQIIELPIPIQSYINRLSTEKYQPAYLKVSKDGGDLLDWGGNISNYGLTNLQTLKPVNEQLDFMVGLLPQEQFPLDLACVKMESGLSTDIHIFPGEECFWILLIDASRDEIRNTLLQQKTNELSLLRKKWFDTWNKIETQSGNARRDGNACGLPTTGESREVSVLQVNMRSFNSYVENKSPAEILKHFVKYLKLIKLPIVDAGGVVMSISGTVVVAVFGVLPTVAAPAEQSLTAALRVLETVKELDWLSAKNRNELFEIGIGIASGTVVMSFMDDKNRGFNAVGYPMEQVGKLECQADHLEIVIDKNTLDEIELEHYCKQLSGVVSKSKHAYSLTLISSL